MNNIINIDDKNEINPFTKPVRINKFLSEAKFCSRREADRLIEDGRVTVDEEFAVPGQKVEAGQIVAVDGKGINISGEYVYLMYNKPEGIICTTDLSVKGNIIEEIEFPERIFPVGRLDKDSTGLIILTNDGEIVNKILRGGNNHEKEYIVEVDKMIDDEFLENMSSGVPILGTITKKCKVKKLEPRKFKIILTQGLNRQIRRMCEYLGYEVISLKRVRIMNIVLGTLKPGKYRYITKKEMAEIDNRIKNSVKAPINYEDFDE